jgi:hypothetical protein
MILMRILPGVLKELSKHVPTVLFQTVEWSELASELPKISRRIIQKEGHEELFHVQKTLLDPYNIVLTNEGMKGNLPKEKWVGEKILTLYFTQVFSPDGLFLDLRSQNFEVQGSDLRWNPNSFWTKFSDEFRQGLIKVYKGFYLDNDDIYYEGLEGIGLLKKDFSPEDKKELGSLFRQHFGGESEQTFNLEKFNQSIISMSNFMLNKKVTISKDFLYLGIYLVTMYSTLEELGGTYPVKQIYLDVRGRFSSKQIG